MNSFTVMAVNLFSLGLVLAGIGFSHQNPTIIVYTFILSTFVRFATIEVLLALGRSPGWKPLLPYFYSSPRPGEKSQPMVDDKGKAVDPVTYFLVFSFIAYLAFLLMHVTADRKLDLPLPVLWEELKWSLVYAGVYWVKDLFNRSLVLYLNETRIINFGYNSSAIALLAFSVLVAGGMVVFFQVNQMNPSPWVVCGPLLAFRHLTEIRKDLKNWA